MAEISSSIYQYLNPQQITPLDPMGAMQQGQRSAIGQMVLQEQRRQRQVEEQTRALYRQYYGQPVSGSGSVVSGFEPGTTNQGPGTLQETVNTPYSSDLQAMLSQYQQEGADVTPTPGARMLPGGGVPAAAGQAPMQRGASPQAGVDTSGLVRALYQIDPKAAQAAEKAAQESQIGQLEMVGKQNAMVSQVARSILMQDTQQAYEVGVRYLQQAGVPVDHLPAMYDRRLVEHYYGMSTDAETRVKEAQSRLYGTQAELEPRKLAFEERRESRIGAHQETQEERLEKQRLETEQHNRNMEKIQLDAAERGWTAEQRQEREAQERERHNLATERTAEGTAARAQSETVRQQENTLRDDFTKQTERHQTRSDFYGQLQAAAKDPTGAGDIAMIYSYMKMLDPGSTVLSGEYATAANAGSIPERVWREYNQAVSGKKLEGLREKYLERADLLYEQSTRDFERTKKVYDERTKRAGGAPENVTQDLGSTYPKIGTGKTLTEQDITDTITDSKKKGNTPQTREEVLRWGRRNGFTVPEH